jgi:hypothetical protein
MISLDSAGGPEEDGPKRAETTWIETSESPVNG